VNSETTGHVTDTVVYDQDEEDDYEEDYIYPTNYSPPPAKKAKPRKQPKPRLAIDPSFPSTKAKAMQYMERGYRLERREQWRDEEWIMHPSFDHDGTPYIISKQTGRALARDSRLVDMSHLYNDSPGHDWSHCKYVVEVLYVE